MNSRGERLHILTKSFDHISLLLGDNSNTPIDRRSNLIADVGISTSTKIADGGGREERRRDQRRRFVGEEKGRRRRSQWGKGSRGEMSGMGNELEKSKG